VCLRGPSAQRTDPRSADIFDRNFNPAPLSAGQLRALVGATARELVWGLPAVAREVRAWRARAGTIPDAPIRLDALNSLRHKRGNVDGAALFWTLPHSRNLNLIRLLASYEIICDFLDSMNEPPVAASPTNGRQLHLSLVDALDPDRQVRDYYRHHPWKDDGGYLSSLVEACRMRCSVLPAYGRVRELVVREATRFEIIAINHDVHSPRREQAHRTWAAREFPAGGEASWFELTAAATASLTIHALLALSAEQTCSDTDIARTWCAYFPWITVATTMLDSFVDQVEDKANGDHSYVAYYQSPELAARRVHELVRRCLHEALALRDGERHTVIAACMVAMYLSKDSARTRAMRQVARSLMNAGGSLTRLLLPILRMWRIAYAQRST
jgi:tetraprenyl-beta-curcumene synthase